MDAAAFEDLLREESPRVLGALLRRYGHFEDAEDAVQEAQLAAWRSWPAAGLPDRPGAWLLTTARNRLLDRLARENNRAIKETAVVPVSAPEVERGPAGLDDDQLRLVFLCCHPVLPMDAQVALTLRAVGGLTTEEIARAYLVPPATMAQRIVRAKRKIAEAGVRFEVPESMDVFEDRIEAVLEVVYLIFTAGHTTSRGDAVVEVDLCREAIRLGRLLHGLLSANSAVTGLLALMLLHDARRAGRADEAGRLIPLAQQDRSTWDTAQIAEGITLVEQALTSGRVGRYQLQAAIAALHAEAPTAADTDWPQILSLYQVLARISPSPAVALNLAVPLAEVSGPAAGLAALDKLAHSPDATALGHRLPAARAHLLERLGRLSEARIAYRRAIALSPSAAESRYLEQRVRELPD
jgi:RNA polymerase sigma factor (sigma-70 family)